MIITQLFKATVLLIAFLVVGMVALMEGAYGISVVCGLGGIGTSVITYRVIKAME